MFRKAAAPLLVLALVVAAPAAQNNERIDQEVNARIRKEGMGQLPDHADDALPDGRVWSAPHGLAQSRERRRSGPSDRWRRGASGTASSSRWTLRAPIQSRAAHASRCRRLAQREGRPATSCRRSRTTSCSKCWPGRRRPRALSPAGVHLVTPMVRASRRSSPAAGADGSASAPAPQRLADRSGAEGLSQDGPKVKGAIVFVGAPTGAVPGEPAGKASRRCADEGAVQPGSERTGGAGRRGGRGGPRRQREAVAAAAAGGRSGATDRRTGRDAG